MRVTKIEVHFERRKGERNFPDIFSDQKPQEFAAIGNRNKGIVGNIFDSYILLAF